MVVVNSDGISLKKEREVTFFSFGTSVRLYSSIVQTGRSLTLLDKYNIICLFSSLANTGLVSEVNVPSINPSLDMPG